MGDARIEVWMDGGCQLCTASRAWVEARDKHRAVAFRDFRNAAEGALPVEINDLERSMWVRSPDGLVAGFKAWREILRVLPRWRWLAFVAGVPPLSWLGAFGYGVVARYRYLISSALRPRV